MHEPGHRVRRIDRAEAEAVVLAAERTGFFGSGVHLAHLEGFLGDPRNHLLVAELVRAEGDLLDHAEGNRVEQDRVDAGEARQDSAWHDPRVRDELARRDAGQRGAPQQSEWIGYLIAHELHRLDRTGSSFLIYDIEVAPGHRRCGVGRSLIAESLRLARECGAGKTWVVTNASNAAAMKL